MNKLDVAKFVKTFGDVEGSSKLLTACCFCPNPKSKRGIALAISVPRSRFSKLRVWVFEMCRS